MNILFLILGCIIFYIIDYETAIAFAKKNFKAFRQYEMNKTLVWYMEQFKATGNKRFLIESKLSPLINSIVAAILTGGVGYFIFNLKFSVGVKILLIAQIIANLIGISMNIIAIYKFKEAKP